MSQFVLDRNASTPAFLDAQALAAGAQDDTFEAHKKLPRSKDVENIPQSLEDQSNDKRAGTSASDSTFDWNKLPRSPEIENIPRSLLAVEDTAVTSNNRNDYLQHSQSATVPDRRHGDVNLGMYSDANTISGLNKIVEQMQIDADQGSSDVFNMSAGSATFDFSPPLSPDNHSGKPIIFAVHNNTTADLPLITVDEVHASPHSLAENEVNHTTTITTNGIASATRTANSSLNKKIRPSRAYYIAKELVMTERTYVKNLCVIAVWLHEAVNQSSSESCALLTDKLFSLFMQLYESHRSFLKLIEQRLSQWEAQELKGQGGEDQCKICDLLLNNLPLQKYESYSKEEEDLLIKLDVDCKMDKQFEHLYRDFEMQKVCYLPLNTFLLKPSQRLLHYQLILEKFAQYYSRDHADYDACCDAQRRISRIAETVNGRLVQMDNIQKLQELQQDLVGIDNLLQTNRVFIREGCLQKLSRKGYQQRMFFLFSDVLLYTSRMPTQSLLFKVHGQLPVAGMMACRSQWCHWFCSSIKIFDEDHKIHLQLEETDKKIAVGNSFAIYSGNRCLLVAASSEIEKSKWLEDLNQVILSASEKDSSGSATDNHVLYPSLRSDGSSEAMEEELADDPQTLAAIDRGQIQHRTNTLMHVCWHRNTSVSMKERSIANRKLLSGFLMRKFKTSNEWQRLWVVFTNFCLFFYKSYRDDFPLASLPLLGYSVQLPSPADNIQEELVFKLQFRNHVYFFRAESEYTFDRWMEVISAATSTSHHMRLFSRLESEQMASATTYVGPLEHTV